MPDGKWIEGLTPNMGVAEAAIAVLSARLEVVRQFLPLAAEKPYENPEYVHQLRVGTRRAGPLSRLPRLAPRLRHSAGQGRAGHGDRRRIRYWRRPAILAGFRACEPRARRPAMDGQMRRRSARGASLRPLTHASI